MRLLLVVTVISILAITVPAKKVRKFDGDFEFAEEVSITMDSYWKSNITLL